MAIDTIESRDLIRVIRVAYPVSPSTKFFPIILLSIGIFLYFCSRNKTTHNMDAASMNNLWSYLQGLSLTASNRKWLAEKLIEPLEEKTATPPVLQTWEEALSHLDESEKEFERGDVISGDEFNVQCQALIDSFLRVVRLNHC